MWWKRPQDHARAAQSALLPLVISEIVKAQVSMPIGLVADQDTFRPVAITGLKAGKSLLPAGVTEVTFYRHFPSENDLIRAYLD